MKRIALYGFALVVALAILVPILYAVLGGFRDTGQLAESPVGLPDPWVWGNYGEILGSATFWRQVWNSTLIAVVSTLLTVPLAALAAFVFARFAFPGRELLYTVFTLGLLFPIAVAILPIFIMVCNLGLLDNPLGVALPQAAFGLPLVVLTEPDKWTLPLGVTNYSTQYTADIARILAFTTLSIVPALVFYAFAERHLVRGLTSGAVKG